MCGQKNSFFEHISVSDCMQSGWQTLPGSLTVKQKPCSLNMTHVFAGK